MSAIYSNRRKGLNSLFRKIIFSNPAIGKLEYGGANLISAAVPLFLWYFISSFSKELSFKIMLAKSQRLLVKTDLLERFSKYSGIASVPFSCGIMGITQPHQKKLVMRHQGRYKFHLFCKAILCYLLIYEECLKPKILSDSPNMLKYFQLLYCY